MTQVEIDNVLAPFLADERLRPYLEKGCFAIWYRKEQGVTVQEDGHGQKARYGIPVHVTTPDEALEWIEGCVERHNRLYHSAEAYR